MFFISFSRICSFFSVVFIEKRARTSLSSRSRVFHIKYHGVAMCTFNKNDWFYDYSLLVLCVCQVHAIMVIEMKKIVCVCSFEHYHKKTLLCTEHSVPIKWCSGQMSFHFFCFLSLTLALKCSHYNEENAKKWIAESIQKNSFPYDYATSLRKNLVREHVKKGNERDTNVHIKVEVIK